MNINLGKTHLVLLIIAILAGGMIWGFKGINSLATDQELKEAQEATAKQIDTYQEGIVKSLDEFKITASKRDEKIDSVDDKVDSLNTQQQVLNEKFSTVKEDVKDNNELLEKIYDSVREIQDGGT